MFFSGLSYKTLSILTIVALAIALGSSVFAIISYRQQEEALEAIYGIRAEVREKMLLDSVLSQYEDNHRSRLDSISQSYQERIDSLAVMLDHLKRRSDAIQNRHISTDSLLPAY